MVGCDDEIFHRVFCYNLLDDTDLTFKASKMPDIVQSCSNKTVSKFQASVLKQTCQIFSFQFCIGITLARDLVLLPNGL